MDGRPSGVTVMKLYKSYNSTAYVSRTPRVTPAYGLGVGRLQECYLSIKKNGQKLLIIIVNFHSVRAKSARTKTSGCSRTCLRLPGHGDRAAVCRRAFVRSERSAGNVFATHRGCTNSEHFYYYFFNTSKLRRRRRLSKRHRFSG